MAWFSSRRWTSAPSRGRAAAPVADPDAALPMLERSDAAWLRDAVAAALVHAGRRGVTTADDHVSAGGMQYGLGNLAYGLAQTPRSAWDRTVRAHVATLVQGERHDTGRTLASVADLLVARVLNVEGLDLFDPRAGYRLVDDLVVCAAIDYPDSVSTLLRADELGGWDVLGPYATAGLGRLPAPDHASIADGNVHVFASEDFFGASRLLILDDLLAAAGLGPAPHGVLVAVPDRHAVLVHVLRDASVVDAVHTMTGVARVRQDRPGAVSPHVYFRGPDGTLQRITSAGPDGIQVRVDGAFAAAFTALGLTSSRRGRPAAPPRRAPRAARA